MGSVYDTNPKSLTRCQQICAKANKFFFFSLSFISRDFAFQNILKCFITKIAEHRVPVQWVT